jgi:hypothetical protein
MVGQQMSNSFVQVESIAISDNDTLTNSWNVDFTYFIYGHSLFIVEDGNTTSQKILDCILLTGQTILILESGMFTIFDLDMSEKIQRHEVEYLWTIKHNGQDFKYINRYFK